MAARMGLQECYLSVSSGLIKWECAYQGAPYLICLETDIEFGIAVPAVHLGVRCIEI